MADCGLVGAILGEFRAGLMSLIIVCCWGKLKSFSVLVVSWMKSYLSFIFYNLQ